MSSQVTAKPSIELSIAGSVNLVEKYEKFEWISFVNGGYIIRGKIDDSWWKTIRKLATDRYLQKGRLEATPVTFSILWDENKRTTPRTAILTELENDGKGAGGSVTFVGVDPPSYFLNSGDASGRVYEGRISDVIKRVVQDYTTQSPTPITVEVTKTQDNPQGKWWMMRQDPKTFIRSLLDWSPSICPDKTSWIVASTDFKIIIREQAEFKGTDFGVFEMNKTGGAKDIEGVELLADSMLTPLQTAIRTAGISAVSGQIFTNIQVNDDNTSNKRNVKITAAQGFKKPPSKVEPGSPGGSTYVTAVPELNGGEMGKNYEEWIDGRARGVFMNMLNMVMRLRITVDGNHGIDSSELLGVSTLVVNWNDADDKPYFLGGKWLIYGFHHDCRPKKWKTHLYLARLDYDAAAKTVLAPIREAKASGNL